MRMTISEYEQQVKTAATLSADGRAAVLKNLKHADVVDAAGNPVEVHLVEQPAEAQSLNSDQINIQAEKAVKAAIAAAGKTNTMPPFEDITSDSFTVKRVGRLNHFKGAGAEEKAHRWGQWALAAFGGNERSKQWCEQHGLHIKAGSLEGINTAGGVLVPDLLESDIIDLRLEYGVFRRYSNVRPMRSDTLTVPRRTGGLTAYFVGEVTAGTASTKTWDNITLTAKKLMVLSKMSSELNEDAVINVGDDLAGEIAYAFSYKEDVCGFNGDGTSAYGGIIGVCPRLITVNGVDDGGGIVLATGNLMSEVTLVDFNRTVARVPTYARRNAAWYVNPVFADSVMQRLIVAAGGTRADDITQGARPAFLGYPVVRTEVMPGTDANSQILALFGDLGQATSFGDRRQTTIMVSPTGTVDGQDVFNTDQLAIRGTERFDIVTHDVGTATAAGPIVGLISAAG